MVVGLTESALKANQASNVRTHSVQIAERPNQLFNVHIFHSPVHLTSPTVRSVSERPLQQREVLVNAYCTTGERKDFDFSHDDSLGGILAFLG